MTPASPFSRQIGWWLVLCAAMVFVMVVLGGATRLTESGLSMVEWKPLTILPPMSDEAWAREFETYQTSPQFHTQNTWMKVEDFKGIYWLEFIHRLWGRMIGLVFLLPFLWFLSKRAVDRPLAWKLGGLFVLGGLQGVLGWFMVASGLVDHPEVSQYRLAAHLFTALILYAALIWCALDQFRRARGDDLPPTDRGFASLATAVAVFVLVVMTSGAFVAGLDAGMIYNTFPLMDGAVIPADLYPVGVTSAFEDVKTVQFNHRMLAITLVALVTVTWIRARRADVSESARKLAHVMLAVAYAQASLGIATLLTVVNIQLALTHQAVALTLLTVALCLAHQVRVAGTVPASLQLKPAE